MEDRL